MTKYGMPGVWTHGFVDMWSPGYLAFMSSNHNGMIRMYEIQGNQRREHDEAAARQSERAGGAAARRRAARRAGSPMPRRSPRDAAIRALREWYRPWPATGEFDWSLRNNTNYSETGVLTRCSTRRVPESHPRELLLEVAQLDRVAGRKDAVAGYVIPAGQRDMTRVERLVNCCACRASKSAARPRRSKLKEGTFPAGSFVIKRDQPYGRLAKILLEKQVFPDPNLRTYDDTSWTMGLMSQTDVKEIADKAVLDVAVDAGARADDQARRHGQRHRVAVRGRALRLEQHDHAALPPEGPEGAGGREGVQAGRRHASRPARSSSAGDAARVQAGGRGARADRGRRCASAPHVPMHDLDLPRLAIYSTWGNTQEVGWVRYAFDKFERAVRPDLQGARARRATCKSAYDVIVIPNQGGSGKRLVFDIELARQAARVQEERAVQEPRDVRRVGRHHRRHGPRRRRRVREVREGGRRARHARRGELLPGRVRPGAEGGRRAHVGRSSTRPGRSSTRRSCSRSTRSSTATTRRRFRCATASGPLLTRADRRQSVRRRRRPAPPPTPQGVLMRYPGGDDHVLSGLMRGANEIRNRAGDRRRAVGQGTRDHVRGQPVLPVAELRRVQHAVQHGAELQRHQDRAGQPARDLSGGTLATRKKKCW